MSLLLHLRHVSDFTIDGLSYFYHVESIEKREQKLSQDSVFLHCKFDDLWPCFFIHCYTKYNILALLFVTLSSSCRRIDSAVFIATQWITFSTIDCLMLLEILYLFNDACYIMKTIFHYTITLIIFIYLTVFPHILWCSFQVDDHRNFYFLKSPPLLQQYWVSITVCY